MEDLSEISGCRRLQGLAATEGTHGSQRKSWKILEISDFSRSLLKKSEKILDSEVCFGKYFKKHTWKQGFKDHRFRGPN